YQIAHGYQDIYLIDTVGNVLYTASEQHVGENIFSEGYGFRNLQQAYRTALDTGGSALSDYGVYGADRQKISHFIARTVEDDDTGEEIGVLIFELPYKQLDSYMQSRFGLGESGQTYLVGADSLLRSTLRLFKDAPLLETRIETTLFRNWLEEHEQWHRLYDQSPESHFPPPRSTKETIYTNYQGIPVLGMYSSLEFLNKWGIHWVLVAEVNKKDAFAEATSLKYIAKASCS
ncbi:MAG: hypothetical protein D3906_14040, partial [Candidatus Electrothrix sp. AUS1_2]|nr:hypothetical protein [Candidatus Electrothrix sp. AUS1_2]